MSSYDAAPLPRLGEVFFDVRGDSRSMRLSWYGDTGVAVFSIWQGGRCTGTFRLPVDELPRMVATLQQGPDDGSPGPGYGPSSAGHASPAGDSRDYDYGAGDVPRYAPGDGRDYLTGEGPAYPAGEGPAYPAGEGRDYAGDDRGYPRYPAGEGRDYLPREAPGYLSGERRDYAVGDAPGYRPAAHPGSAAAQPDAGPYDAWAGPESAAHPQGGDWADGYGDDYGDDYADSEATRYGQFPPGPRQDRRLAAESGGGTGHHGPPPARLPGPALLG